MYSNRLIALSVALLIASFVCLTQAQVPMTGAGLGKRASGATATTWNPSDKSANITLSNGNLTYTDGAASYAGVRAIASLSGLKYWEMVLTIIATPASVTIGIGNASASLSSFEGSDTNSIGVSGNGVVFGGGGQGPVAGWAQGNTLSIAVDTANNTIWWRTNAGNWNNNASANPATNTLGITLSGLAAGPYYPMGLGLAVNDSGVANFGPSFSQSVPSGFSGP